MGEQRVAIPTNSRELVSGSIKEQCYWGGVRVTFGYWYNGRLNSGTGI